jgi:hypothetical protein
MTHGITLLALVGLGLGARRFLQYAAIKHAHRQHREALQTWEGEGGAVPTGGSQIAAQVSPRVTDAGVSAPARGGGLGSR